MTSKCYAMSFTVRFCSFGYFSETGVIKIQRKLGCWSWFVLKLCSTINLFKNWDNVHWHCSSRLSQLFGCVQFASAVIHAHSIFTGWICVFKLWTYVRSPKHLSFFFFFRTLFDLSHLITKKKYIYIAKK